MHQDTKTAHEPGGEAIIQIPTEPYSIVFPYASSLFFKTIPLSSIHEPLILQTDRLVRAASVFIVRAQKRVQGLAKHADGFVALQNRDRVKLLLA